MPKPTRVNAWLALQSGLWIAVLALPIVLGRPADGLDRLRIQLPALFISWMTLHLAAWPWQGPADAVTAARGLGWVIVLFASPDPGAFDPAWAGAFCLLLALDLLDGRIARRTRTTESGAWIDMETDQLAVLVMSLLAAPLEGVGPAILALPLLRYVFVVAMFLTRRPAHLPKPVRGDNRRGRWIFVGIVAILMVLLWTPLPTEVRRGLSVAAILLLGSSFLGDARHLLLWRRTREPAG